MQCGFFELDITPPLGVYIGGGWKARYGQGVLDPLYVNAVAFGDGEKSAVLLVLDNLGLYGVAGETWHKKIVEKLDEAYPKGVFKDLNEEIKRMLSASKKKK